MHTTSSSSDPPQTLPSLGVSIVRTAVPYAWTLLLGWLLSLGLPPQLVAALEPVAPLLVLTAGTAIYAGARCLERQPWMPGWLTAVLLGSTRQPVYLHAQTAGVYRPDRPLSQAGADEIRRQPFLDG